MVKFSSCSAALLFTLSAGCTGEPKDSSPDEDPETGAEGEGEGDPDTDTGGGHESGPAHTGDSAAAPVDVDGDGYGTDDCDDADPDVHPGAEEECGDHQNENCDGDTSCRRSGVAVYDSGADYIYVGASDSAYLAFAMAAAGDVNADGYDDLLLGGWRSGHTYLLEGPLPSALDGGTELDLVGTALAGGLDLDGDAYADAAIAVKESSSYTVDGEVLLYSGASDGAAAWSSTSYTSILASESLGQGFGAALASGGDFDNHPHNAPHTSSGWSMKGLRLPWMPSTASLRARSLSLTGSLMLQATSTRLNQGFRSAPVVPSLLPQSSSSPV